MSHHPPTGAAPVTQNERRADRAMHAIEAGSDCEFRDGAVAGLERDVRDLLANLRHLCDRWRLDHGAVDARAQTTYLGDHTEAPLVAVGAPGALDREAEPVRRCGGPCRFISTTGGRCAGAASCIKSSPGCMWMCGKKLE